MRLFFLLTAVLAALVGWIAARPMRLADTLREGAAPATPPERQNGWPGTVQIARNVGGHFSVSGSVDGSPLTFVVDTGASQVALGRADATRAGVRVTDADFKGEARTASGTIRVAYVRLSRVRVGTIELPDVPAIVLDVADAMPLLGQSFLGRIDKVAIERDRMTLTKL